MGLIIDTFAIEVLNDEGKWKEISAVHYKRYFEDPDKSFLINKDDERKLYHYRETSENPIVRLITLKYNNQTNIITNYIVIEFYRWTITNGRVVALADSVKKYSLTESEYKKQKEKEKED